MTVDHKPTFLSRVCLGDVCPSPQGQIERATTYHQIFRRMNQIKGVFGSVLQNESYQIVDPVRALGEFRSYQTRQSWSDLFERLGHSREAETRFIQTAVKKDNLKTEVQIFAFLKRTPVGALPEHLLIRLPQAHRRGFLYFDALSAWLVADPQNNSNYPKYHSAQNWRKYLASYDDAEDFGEIADLTSSSPSRTFS